jgi:hypothetical protein
MILIMWTQGCKIEKKLTLKASSVLVFVVSDMADDIQSDYEGVWVLRLQSCNVIYKNNMKEMLET